MQRVWSAIELVLRRYPWAITLAALVPCAYFDAAGINHLVASSLFRADVDSLTRPAIVRPGTVPTASEIPNHRQRDVALILRRDVFDADAGCLNCAPAEVAAAPTDGGTETAAVDDGSAPPPCDGQAKVTGAVVIEDPLWSFVFLSPGGTQPAMPFRVGQVLDGKTVAIIGWDLNVGAYVVFRQGTQRCYYAQIMPPRAPAAPAAGPAPPRPPADGTSSELAAALDAGIERAGPNSYSVRRSLVDRILESQAELMRTTRIVPVESGGRVTGVRMAGVRPGSLLGRLGLQEGDVLSQINGLDIGSPDRALEAYSRLRSADRISLSVTRGGQPVNIDFNIHQ